MKVVAITPLRYRPTAIGRFVLLLVPALLCMQSIHAAPPDPMLEYTPGSRLMLQAVAPGKMVDIGTHRLYLHCEGDGTPTIVVDTGLGSVSLEWLPIQQALAPHTRICLYDRAGYGYSDPGPIPRTSRYIVDELRTLLQRADIEGPFILVGHSFGGYNMQLFARRFPDLTSAVVLIDSSHPDQYERFLAPPINVKTAPPNKPRLGVVNFSPPAIHPKLPRDLRKPVLTLMGKMKMRYAVAYEFYNFRKSAEEVQDYEAGFPAVPLLVLSRGKRVYPEGEQGDLMEVLWMDLQKELSLLNRYGSHIVAHGSDHFIHLDQPQLVIDSLSFLLEVLRFRRMNRNYPVDLIMALEPNRYDFFDATWQSNRLYQDIMLGHIFPATASSRMIPGIYP